MEKVFLTINNILLWTIVISGVLHGQFHLKYMLLDSVIIIFSTSIIQSIRLLASIQFIMKDKDVSEL